MIFSLAILAVSLSLDALAVGISYGMRKVRISIVSRIVICFFSVIYSAAAIYFGSTLSKVLPAYISKRIGVIILLSMGIWVITQAVIRRNDQSDCCEDLCFEGKTLVNIVIKSLGITVKVIKNPASCDVDKSGTIDPAESLMLGLALSVDAIGVGIGSSLSGFNSFLIPLSVGFFQMVFLYAGTFLGIRFASVEKLNKMIIPVIPGVLLILLAILRIK